MLDEREAVDHVARFDGLDRDAFRRSSRRLQPIGAERERLAQFVDELVHLGEAVAIVQAALELIAEQVAEALSGANALDHAERDADALGGEVDGQRLPVLLARRWR